MNDTPKHRRLVFYLNRGADLPSLASFAFKGWPGAHAAGGGRLGVMVRRNRRQAEADPQPKSAGVDWFAFGKDICSTSQPVQR